ncbi:Peptidyl-prolyl cis-trans isomerase PASTICCINO1 [Micractinium conductrix]|uniref:peptidylprolyl isomerase n=1 Tax=Micractinium conductrix TaxID=554055 RepID=A0A2P6V266_9CHLO|nr:Peptidyl-prolyl cis-trans isomerase PASTICCINO1 [Micractinium conductrix]|eukprot:PSC68182.1 Peptidyl-prolyl cis-trans isomerase PASTICCINO1 [Micractinium conductrix]
MTSLAAASLRAQPFTSARRSSGSPRQQPCLIVCSSSRSDDAAYPRRHALAGLAGVAAAACLAPAVLAAQPPAALAASDFVQTPSGLLVQDITAGTGRTPQPGDRCVVHWAGYTKNYQAKRIDNTSVRDEPFEFVLGGGEVIPAFDEAVAGMAVGGVRRVEVLGEIPELGYPRDRAQRFVSGFKYRYGPQPSELGGKRALDFILDNRTLSDTNRTLLLDIKLLAGLAGLLAELRKSLAAPEDIGEPDVDEKDLGIEDAAKFREEEDLQSGAVLKGTLEPGEEGGDTPRDGDLVWLHYSLMNEHRDVLRSTRAEHGGAGTPQPFVMGRGKARMLRGMELGVQEMARGERAMLDLKPAYAFLHADSGLPLPAGLRKEAPVLVDVTLTHFERGGSEGGARCCGGGDAVLLRTLGAGQGWESPRPPFEVTFHVTARAVSSSGRQGEGEPYFDSTSGGEPLACSLGAGQLPPAVEAALAGMQRQQEAVALCPVDQLCGGGLLPDPPGAAELAARGQGAAPAYAEVWLRLLDFSQVRDMTGDGQVVKRIVRKGRGEFPVDCPLDDSRVSLHYRVRPQGGKDWLSDTRGADGQAAPAELETGMGEVPESLDMCVRLMLTGEVAALTASWRYCYEGRDDAPEGLPPSSSVEFEVELASFDRQPSQHALGGAEKLQRSAQLKEQGNALYKQGRTRLAKAKYGKALKLVERALDLDTDEEVAAASALKASCFLNMARCAEREQEWGEALGWCNKAIDEDDGYAKAYFRRAVIAACLGDEGSAGDDLALCAQLDPSTAPDCERELARMAKRAAAAEAKQRGALKGFFDR